MARIGKYRVGFNKRANAFTIVLNIALLVIWLYVGSTIITTIQTVVGCPDSTAVGNCSASIFYSTYKFLGINQTINASNSGLIGIIGILLAVGVLAQAFRVSRAGRS